MRRACADAPLAGPTCAGVSDTPGEGTCACPAGEDVPGPCLDDRRTFTDTVLRPLQDKKETLYVLPGSRAQEYARRRFPHKPVKEVTGGRQPPAKRSASVGRETHTP